MTQRARVALERGERDAAREVGGLDRDVGAGADRQAGADSRVEVARTVERADRLARSSSG
jgi:hypothetical protein